MYHVLLTNRYLTTRVIPFIAVAAVALCVALVIIVVSVMTGFLEKVRASGRVLMGDVIVQYPVEGIPYYERLIDEIMQLDGAEAATPIVESWGLLRMPYPDPESREIETVQFWGIEPESFAKVTGYMDTLYWREIESWQRDFLLHDLIERDWDLLHEQLSEDELIDLIHELQRAFHLEPIGDLDDEAVRMLVREMDEQRWRDIFLDAAHHPELLQQYIGEEQWQTFLSRDARLIDDTGVLQQGLTLQRNGEDGIVLGMHVSRANERQRDGSYFPLRGGHWWMPRFDVTLTTFPLIGGLSDPESRVFSVANEFVSGVFLIDDNRVMIPLEVAQQMLHLDESSIVDPDDPFEVIGIDPGRATMVLVRSVDGVRPRELRDQVEEAYSRFRVGLANDPEVVVTPPPLGFGLGIRTWEQQQAQFIAPVEKERELMRILFSIIYIVCAGLVLAIFWAIVHEKTRDIGILRSIGASRLGISMIFLRYGLVIGVIGSIVGLGLAYLVVHNINAIHDAVGEPAPPWSWITAFILSAGALAMCIFSAFHERMLPVVLWALGTIALQLAGLGLYFHRGTLLWDPTVYYFAEIPNTLDMFTAVTTMVGAVVFSIIGAFVPAAKAADTDPVNALRYE